MHTTGTTTPDGVHQLAPGLGERRFMPPPSGGQFKLPGELPAELQQAAQKPQVAHEPQAALPGHAVNLEGAMHVQGLPAAVQQVVGGLRPAEAQALQERFPSVAPSQAQPQLRIPVVGPSHEGLGAEMRAQLTHVPSSPHARILPTMPPPPAPAGYQSAPMGVPPGMVPHTVQHAAPQGLSGMQPQGFMVVNTPGGLQPALPQTASWPMTGPVDALGRPQLRPDGSLPGPMEVVPHSTPAARPVTHTVNGVSLLPEPKQPHVQAHRAPGTVLRLEGPQDSIEAAIGMLMLRGLHVTVVPS